MKAVVVGGSGQIGGWLLRHLADRGHAAVGTYSTVAQPGLVQLDAAELDAASRWLASERPEVVFFPAGFTWVDGCERDPGRNLSANVEQPLNLALAARSIGALFVHFSTDYLFDGAAGPYAEDAPPAPLNAYGAAKLEAEGRLLEALGEGVLIARTCWVFGPERQGKNFAYQLARTLRQGRELPCPSDQWGSPSYGPDVAGAVVSLAESGASGVVHVAGPETIDRPSFARAVAEGFGLDPAAVVGRPTAGLAQGAARPLRSGLRTDRLRALVPDAVRPLADAMVDFRRRVRPDSGEGWADPLG